MKTVVINNQKGGVGKTTLAAHAGWYLSEIADARVLLIDLDTQGNLTSVFPNARVGYPAGDLFFEAVEAFPGPTGLTLFPASSRLHSVAAAHNTTIGQFLKNMQALSDCYDYCVVDTPPSWGATTFAAIASASGMLSPMDLGKFSLDGTKALLQQLQTINDQVRSAKPVELFGILVSRYISTSPDQRATLAKVVAGYSESILFPGVVTQRQAYDQAIKGTDDDPTARPVWAMKGNRAAQEAAKEMRDILDHLKLRLDQGGDAL